MTLKKNNFKKLSNRKQQQQQQQQQQEIKPVNSQATPQNTIQESSPFIDGNVEGDLFQSKKKEREEEERRKIHDNLKNEDPSTNEFGFSQTGKINNTKISNVLHSLDELDSMFDEVLN